MTLRLQLARQLCAAALVVCLVCLASWKEFLGPAPPDTISPIIDQYEELKSSLPSHGVVCYFTDSDVMKNQAALWFLAEYTLVPLVVRVGSDCEWAIGAFENSLNVDRLDSIGFRIERAYGPQLLLLRRKQP